MLRVVDPERMSPAAVHELDPTRMREADWIRSVTTRDFEVLLATWVLLFCVTFWILDFVELHA